MKQEKSRETRRAGKDPLSDAFKKMNVISEATKVLAAEVKTMSKIFAENQKILISLKSMIDGVNSSLDSIQKGSRQINILEEDTQRLFHGMSQVKAHSNLIEKINDQISRLQGQVEKINQKQEDIPDVSKLMQSISDNLDSTRNNTKMIMHLSEKTEKIREDLKSASGKPEALSSISSEIEEVKKSTRDLVERSDKISRLEENISSLKEEVEKVATKTEPIVGLDSQIRNVGAEIDSLVKKAESFGSLGGEIRNVNAEFASFRDNVLAKTRDLEQKMSDFVELLSRNSASITEFNKTTFEISKQLGEIRGITHKASQNTSREVMGLLKLSEFQSNIRMRSESKYGTLDDIQKMVSQTVDMINLFDRLSIESESKIPLPLEVKQWSVSKILDCADRWEVRFTDVFRMLVSELGADLVKESLRTEQVRDLFGIRAVDEVRHELNIS